MKFHSFPKYRMTRRQKFSLITLTLHNLYVKMITRQHENYKHRFSGLRGSCTEMKKCTIKSEDLRVQKTKSSLKQALISLLTEKTFEQITVTEICTYSAISRITFYAHYADKYELADAVFQDMVRIAKLDFCRLQKENNPKNDPIVGCENLLESILNLYYNQFQFFSHVDSDENPYLQFSFHQYVFRHVRYYIQKEHSRFQLKYSLKQMTGFLCNGIWGFIRGSFDEKCPIKEICTKAKELLRGVLQAGVLILPTSASN